MNYYDIVTKRTYSKNGEEKVQWLKAGKLTRSEDGKMYITLFHQPETTFYVFEQKAEDKMQGVLPPRETPPTVTEESLGADGEVDIPF